MKKKIICAILAAIMTMGTLAACGEKAPTSTPSSKPADSSAPVVGTDTPASEAETPVAKKYDDVKLNYLICWNGGFKTAADQYNNDVAKLIREKTGVTVTFEQIMMSEVEKLNLLFASGDMPDMINAPYWGGNGGETQVIKKAGAEGRLLDIKNELPKYENLKGAYDIGVISQSYLEKDLEIPEFNGARYILPQETPGNVESIANWTYGVFVRGDVPKTLGIDPQSIKTEEQLYDFMKKAKDHGFKDVNGNATITATTYHEGWDKSKYAEGFGSGNVTSFREKEDGTLTWKALDDAWVNEHMYIWKMVNEGILDKECFKHADSQADEKVGNGTALFAACQFGPVINSTKLTGLYQQNPEMNYVPVGPLNFANGKPITQIETQGRSGSPAIIFPTSCKDLGAALTWLDYLNSKEGMQLIEYGIVGDTCELNADGQPRLKQDILDKKLKGDTTVDQELRDKGVSYMTGRTICADKKLSWFGEGAAGAEFADPPALTAYKKLRPVTVVPGYPLDKLTTDYKDYAKFSAAILEGTDEKDYTERAYFAKTEAEARKILQEYQDKITKADGGILGQYLKYAEEKRKENPDAII